MQMPTMSNVTSKKASLLFEKSPVLTGLFYARLFKINRAD
jgi:hypothetical protein